MKLNLKKIALIPAICLGLQTTVFSMEVRPFVEGKIPGKANVSKKINGKEGDFDTDSKFMVKGGTEAFFNIGDLPLRYGLGAAYLTPIKDENGDNLTPAMLPFWLSFGVGTVNPNKVISPYGMVRVGFPTPLTEIKNWWRKPQHFTVNGGAGIVFPYRIGLEVNYEYTSLLKHYNQGDTRYRVSTGRVGIQLSMGFGLFESDQPKEEPKKESSVQEMMAQDTVAQEPAETYEDPYATTPVDENGNFADPYATTPVDSNGNFADPYAPAPVDSTPSFDPYATTPTEATPAEQPTEEPAADSAEPVSGETPAEQPAEEAAAEPAAEEAAPEPVVEETAPAPKPEAKKKTTAKKKAAPKKKAAAKKKTTAKKKKR